MTATSSRPGGPLAAAAVGPSGNDRIFGTAGNDTIFGGLGGDFIYGRDGDDFLIGEEGRDRLFGEAGNDRLLGGRGSDVLSGGSGADRLEGQGEADSYVVDNVGDLVLEGVNAGRDRVFSFISYTLPDNVEDLILSGGGQINGTGNDLNNVISVNRAGASISNVLAGGPGNDRLYSGSGDDTLSGGQGNDLLVGGGGADDMTGGLGNDTYVTNNDRDRTIEDVGEGTDRVFSSLGETLEANVENLILTGVLSVAGFGNELRNVMIGNPGRNFLDGGDGNDVLLGGAGRDTIVGSLGKDDLRGEAGADTFAFRTIAESPGTSGRDVIRDFTQGQDRINLAPIDANTLVAGDQAFTFVGSAAFTGTAGELRYEANVVRADVNGDGTADLLIAMGNGTDLAAGDFLL